MHQIFLAGDFSGADQFQDRIVPLPFHGGRDYNKMIDPLPPDMHTYSLVCITIQHA
jgi:hypothetical protein